MSEPYPCALELARSERFERAHVVLRLFAFLALAVMGIPLIAVFFALYLLLPANNRIFGGRGRTGPSLTSASGIDWRPPSAADAATR